LPLLSADEKGNGMPVSSVALVPEGPEPLLVQADCSAPRTAPLGTMKSTPSVQAWLRLCKPAALWSAAGGAHGFAPISSCGGTPRGAEVVEALQAAFKVHLTEQMVMDVWDALSELDASKSLVRRASGTWTQVSNDVGTFVL
jgi:hypothetical protein